MPTVRFAMPGAFAEALRRLGVGDERCVVIYDAKYSRGLQRCGGANGDYLYEVGSWDDEPVTTSNSYRD